MAGPRAKTVDSDTVSRLSALCRWAWSAAKPAPQSAHQRSDWRRDHPGSGGQGDGEPGRGTSRACGGDDGKQACVEAGQQHQRAWPTFDEPRAYGTEQRGEQAEEAAGRTGDRIRVGGLLQREQEWQSHQPVREPREHRGGEQAAGMGQCEDGTIGRAAPRGGDMGILRFQRTDMTDRGTARPFAARCGRWSVSAVRKSWR